MRICDFCGNEIKKPSKKVYFAIDGVSITLECIDQDICPACIDEVDSKMRELIKGTYRKRMARNNDR